MRFLSVRVQMWQAQEKDSERRKRRKEELPEDSYLGHAVKNCMTVIGSMGRYQVREEFKLALCGQLSLFHGKVYSVGQESADVRVT